VTEQSSLDEFLTNAELANSNFESGKKLYIDRKLVFHFYRKNLSKSS
jgi:hypothetical protein